MLAFVHFIVPPFLIKLFNGAKKVSPKILFFAAIGGLFPDADYFYVWAINLINGETLSFTHRTLFHNVFFVGLLFVLVLLLYSQNNKYAKYILAFAFGCMIHFLIDIIDTHAPIFYPLSTQRYGLSLFDSSARARNLMMIDTALFTIWVVYLSLTNKLKSIL